MQLTSAKNPVLQKIRRAAAEGRATDEGCIVIEGPHLLQEALRGKWRVERIFVTPEARNHYFDLLRELSCEVIELSARAMASTAATESPQEVLALLTPRHWTWHELVSPAALIVVLDGIQDPGNAGTIVRSAEAFGASGVVFLKGCSRVANGKLLRATAGSIFRIPFLEGVTVSELAAHLRASQLNLYALTATGEAILPEVNLRAHCALAIGSEGAGLSPELLSGAQTLRIPTSNVESLNAAMACSIALFEAQQQRTHEQRTSA